MYYVFSSWLVLAGPSLNPLWNKVPIYLIYVTNPVTYAREFLSATSDRLVLYSQIVGDPTVGAVGSLPELGAFRGLEAFVGKATML